MTRRTLALLLLALLAGCGSPKNARTFPAPKKRYTLIGEILRLNPKGQSVVIKHQKIEGWMDAMTMEFPVATPEEFSRLRERDHIQATVFVNDLDFWIGDIHPAR
jgi:Cu/Ag efflux protein CusF